MYIYKSIYKSSSHVKKSFLSKYSFDRRYLWIITQITDPFRDNQPVTSLAFAVLVRYSLSDCSSDGKNPK